MDIDAIKELRKVWADAMKMAGQSDTAINATSDDYGHIIQNIDGWIMSINDEMSHDHKDAISQKVACQKPLLLCIDAGGQSDHKACYKRLIEKQTSRGRYYWCDGPQV